MNALRKSLTEGTLPLIPGYDPDLFVNREPEIKMIMDTAQALSRGEEVRNRTIVFWGYKGAGRTWLLRHIEGTLGRALDVKPLYVDLEAYAGLQVHQALGALFDEFAKGLWESDAGRARLYERTKEAWPAMISPLLTDAIGSLLERQVLVLLLDHVYESEWHFIEALEERLLAPLAMHPRVLIVMAGRGQAYPWRTPELRLYTHDCHLPPFDEKLTEEQLGKQLPEAAPRTPEIHKTSHGYPLANYLLATRPTVAQAMQETVDGLLTGVPAEERSWLEALCILRTFDEDHIPIFLAVYIDNPSIRQWSYRQIRQVRDRLLHTRMVRWDEQTGGWVVDGAIRPVLEEYLQETKPQLRRYLHREAYYLYESWSLQYPVEQSRWQAEVAYHIRHMPSIDSDWERTLSGIRSNASKGKALAYHGEDLSHAEKVLQEAGSSLLALTPHDDFQSWQRNVWMADVLNAQGYLYHTFGRCRQAITAYQQALLLWRSLTGQATVTIMRTTMQAQHADTLNNLSWVLAEVGSFHQAIEICHEALKIREHLDQPSAIAFSLNTLGWIQIKDDQTHSGRLSCQRALDMFRDLGLLEGVGLAHIALAEALQGTAGVPRIDSPEEGVKYLRQAVDHARQAVEIFDGRVPGRPQLIQALIELGCIYRDWAWIRDQYEGADPDHRILVSKAEDSLRRAIREGEGEPGLLHMSVDAQVNLAWLFHDAGEDDRAARELDTAIQRVPPEYHITTHGLPTFDLPQTFLWARLGKAQLLYGAVAMRQFRQSTEPERLTHLETMAHHFTLSLAYDELFAADFPDMRRGIEYIYDSLKELNWQEEFPLVHRSVDRVAEAYNLPKPTRMHRFLADFHLGW
jgi:tetratricopeptide (TPR) repeat protein